MADTIQFKDRGEVGRRLADRLAEYRDASPVVLGLTPRGVPAAVEVARALGAELDVIVARLLSAPEPPHAGIGAVAPSGVIVLDRPAIEAAGLDESQVEQIASLERSEMRRRMENYRGQMDLDLDGRLAILVDDGAATGMAAVAAAHAARAMGARQVVLALGVCSSVAAERLRPEVDELVCIATPEPFRAVADFFEAEEDLSEDEVLELLAQARDA